MRTIYLIAGFLGLSPAFAHAQGAPTAVFIGTVVDSAHNPIADAQVSLPGVKAARLTDENGLFRIRDIPAGPQRVVVRRIGFSQLDTTIVFVENQSVQRRVTLGRVVTLDSVVVEASRFDPLMEEFEENRGRGFGHFVTRSELSKNEGRSLASIMTQLQGLNVLRGHSSEAWILGKRAPISRCPPIGTALNAAAAQRQQASIDDCLRQERLYYVPTEAEARQGLSRECFALVYLDRSPLNGGHPTLPFDANTFTASQLQAVEWYESAADVPMKYNGFDARCGLAILHTRRGS